MAGSSSSAKACLWWVGCPAAACCTWCHCHLRAAADGVARAAVWRQSLWQRWQQQCCVPLGWRWCCAACRVFVSLRGCSSRQLDTLAQQVRERGGPSAITRAALLACAHLARAGSMHRSVNGNSAPFPRWAIRRPHHPAHSALFLRPLLTPLAPSLCRQRARNRVLRAPPAACRLLSEVLPVFSQRYNGSTLGFSAGDWDLFAAVP